MRLICPVCRLPLSGQECRCGYRYESVDGIVDLMTPSQKAEYDGFLSHYECVRESEGWGEDDLDLPFAARRNQYVWNVRKRTFRRLSRILAHELPRRGDALDAAAGNCWLSRHLVSWGFDVTALDVSVGARDGLAAARYFLDRGFEFERVRAPVESLPFADRSFDLIVVAGAFHYMDQAGVLGEFRRVLRELGRVIIFDSPWYERVVDGDRALDERAREHRRKYGATENTEYRSSYLLRERFERATRDAGFVADTFRVWAGPRRTWDAMRARLRFQRIATFPLIVLRVGADEPIG